MLKKIKNILFVICVVMVFTAQTKRPDDKGQQHAPAARPAPASRPAPAGRPQVQTRRAAPQQVQRTLPRVNINIPKPLDERRQEAPRVYALPVALPAQSNRLFNRQHHNHWRPLYNFYNGQYQFYPYVNVTSSVELSANCVAVAFNGQTYYYDRGSFYLQDAQGQYFAVVPPLGIIVNALPAWAKQVSANGQLYFHCKGVFYVQVGQGYQVVEALPGVSDA